jgi:hypothetical protein
MLSWCALKLGTGMSSFTEKSPTKLNWKSNPLFFISRVKEISFFQVDFNLEDVEARWERILCPTNIKKAPKKPRVFNVVNRSNCT